MGMDVLGPNPTAPEGEYFRPSIWQWSLLVKVLKTLCPVETSNCKNWEHNDGDGLNSVQTLALAEALERKLGSGEVAFALCNPAVISKSAPQIVTEIEALFGSQGLDLKHDDPFIDEHFVAKFAAFLRASGGFSIW
jgi:hypothetical protein